MSRLIQKDPVASINRTTSVFGVDHPTYGLESLSFDALYAAIVDGTNVEGATAPLQRLNEKGAPNGYASLGAGGVVPSTQLPDIYRLKAAQVPADEVSYGESTVQGALDTVFSSLDTVLDPSKLGSVAELKAITYSALSDGDKASTLGYSSAGDGGATDYYWDSASTEPETLGSYFKAAGQTVEPGRWVALNLNNVLQFAADPTGVSDSRDSLVEADEYFAAAGKETKIPAGTYLIGGEIDFKSSWMGEGEGATTILLTPTNTNARSLRIQPNVPRAEQLSASQTSGATRVAINDQSTGLGYVTCSTPADASSFPEGSIVHVAFGKNIFDADDNLWRFDNLFKVTDSDPATGIVSLDGYIDMDVSDDGYYPSSPKNTAPVWLNSTSYTAGDFVRSGTVTGTLWEATTSGTSSGTSPADDTGVTWMQVSNSIGAGKNEDFRPIIQLVNDPRSDIRHSGYTLKIETPCVAAFEIRSVKDFSFEAIELLGKYAIGAYVPEASRDGVFRDVKITGEGGLVGATGYRATSGYNARNILFDNCKLRGGRKISSTRYEANRWESASQIVYRSCDFHATDGRADTYGFFFDTCEAGFDSCRFVGYDSPLRKNLNYYSSTFVLDNHNFFIDKVSFFSGNRLQMDSRNVRALDYSPSIFNATNTYSFYNNYSGSWNQSAVIEFNPARLVSIPVTFTPLTAQANTDIPIPDVADGLLGTSGYKMLVLGVKAKWDTPAADAIDIRMQVTRSGVDRGVFSAAADSSTAIRLDDGTTYSNTAQLWDQTGTGHRLINPKDGEALTAAYYSGATAGGTVTLMVYALVEEGFEAP